VIESALSMQFARDKRKWLSWLTFGAAVGTYLPWTPLPVKLSVWVHWIGSYPYWLHLPVIALLFLVCLERTTQILRRYGNNLRSKKSPFTLIEATLATTAGLVFATVLRSIPLHLVSMLRQSTSVAWVWILSLVLFGVVAVLRSQIAPKRLAPGAASATTITDAPITEDAEDTLGRVPFVKDFYEQIKKFPFNESMVFGLNGRWGYGKTSVLNLLRNRLRNDREIILVDFNPWYFSSADVLVHRFYSAIAGAINKEFFFPDLASLARRYSTLLAPILKRFGLEINVGETNVEDVKRQVEQYIEQTGRRVVVVVDDIDRTDADELLWVFRTVRLTAEFKNTTFVLAYDENQVREHLKSLDISPDYLEKIVQNPIQLPALDQGNIDRFLLYSDSGHKSQLDLLFDELKIETESRAEFDKKIVELYPSDVRPFFRSLRPCKRFLNGLSTRLPVVQNEVYLLDFVFLEVLRLFAPKIYQDIYDNRYYYIPEWTLGDTLASPFGIADRAEKDKVSKEVRAHVEELLAAVPCRENILDILKELFFVRLNNAFGGSRYSDDFAPSIRAKKRLTHPESFQKYFLLSVPRGAIPDGIIEGTLKSWATATDPSALIRKDFEGYQIQSDLQQFLDSITLFRGKVDDKTVDPLLSYISSNIQMFSRERGRSLHDAAFRLVIFLLNDRVKDAEKQVRVEQTLRETPALDFAVYIVSAIAGSQSAELYALQHATDLTAAKQVVSDRLRKEVIDAGVDLFNASPHAGYVLFQIGTWSAELKQIVNEYAMKLCKQNPSDIGKLVGGFFIDFGDNSSFNLSDLRRVYDSRALAQLARTAGESAWNEENQQRAIQQLLIGEPESGSPTTPSE
jgi:KAP family P-loop domain